MFLLIIYIILIGLNLYKRDSKILFISLLVFLWLLFGWSYGNADWNIYVNRYTDYIARSSATEPLFTAIIWIGHLIGLEYRQFLIGLSGICLVLIAKTIFDCSKEPGFILALYAIFSFPMDVTQVRFFVASAVIWFGFRWLFAYRDYRQKKDLIKWIVSVLVACGMHLSVCIILLLLIPLHFKRRITVLVTVVLNAIIIFVNSFQSMFFSLVANLWSTEKANTVAATSAGYTWASMRYVWFKIAIIFIGFLIIYLASYQLLSRRRKVREDYNVILKNMDFAMDCNIVILVIAGLVTVTNDFYRLQQIIVMLNYFVFSTALLPRARERGKAKLQNVIVIGVSLIFAVGALYFLVMRTSNYNSVFYPLFFENVLFS